MLAFIALNNSWKQERFLREKNNNRQELKWKVERMVCFSRSGQQWPPLISGSAFVAAKTTANVRNASMHVHASQSPRSNKKSLAV